jgi:anti-sigma B factor antagonist
MRPLARLAVDRTGDLTVATIEGEIDASNAPEIADELRAEIDNRAAGLVVDLTPTRYLDSAGINLLFSLGDDLRARQMRLRLVVAPGSSIARMLAITSLDRTYPIYATVEEARAGA